MEPARRQWLAAFTLALLLHVVAGMALIASWQERPRLPATAGAGGVEVALFPGFEQALREASIETPDMTGTEAAPLEPALTPPESAPLEAMLPNLVEAVPSSLLPESAEAAPVPLDPSTAPVEAVPLASVESSPAMEAPEAVVAETVLLDSVEPWPVTEASEAVEALPATHIIEASERVDLAGLVATAIPASPDLPAETLHTAEAPPADPVAPTEVIRVPEAVDTVAVADAVAALELPESGLEPVRETPPASVAEPAPPSMPESLAELPVLAPQPAAEAPLASARMTPAPVEPEMPAALPDVVATYETPALDPEASEVLEILAMVPLEVVRALEPEPAPRPAEQTLRDPAESEEGPVSESPIGSRPTAPPEASEDGIVAAAPPPSSAPEDTKPALQPARPGIEAAYLAALQARLERYKDYPRPAQRRGEEGTVLLRFTINRYGMVIEHAIVQSSGFQSLDNSVEHMIRRAQPLPAIPHEMGRDWMHVILPVDFQLER